MLVVGQLPLASCAKPLGHVVVSVCFFVVDGSVGGEGTAFEGGNEEGGSAFPNGGLPVGPRVSMLSLGDQRYCGIRHRGIQDLIQVFKMWYCLLH